MPVDPQEEILRFRAEGLGQTRTDLKGLTDDLVAHRIAMEDYNRVIAASGKPTSAQTQAYQRATFPGSTFGQGARNYGETAAEIEKVTKRLAEQEAAERSLADFRARQTGRPQLAEAQAAAAAQYGRTPLDMAAPGLASDITTRQSTIDGLLTRANAARTPAHVQQWTQQAMQEIDALAKLQDAVYAKPFPDAARRLSEETQRRAAAGTPFTPVEYAAYRNNLVIGQRVTGDTDPILAAELERQQRGEYRLIPHKEPEKVIQEEALRRRRAGTPFTPAQYEEFKEQAHTGRWVSDDEDPFLKEEMAHAQRTPFERTMAHIKGSYSKEGLLKATEDFTMGYALFNLGDAATVIPDTIMKGERYTPESLNRSIAGLLPAAMAIMASPMGPGASLGAAGLGSGLVSLYDAGSERDEKVRLASEQMATMMGKGAAGAGHFADVLNSTSTKLGVPVAELGDTVAKITSTLGGITDKGMFTQGLIESKYGEQYTAMNAADLDYATSAPLNREFRENISNGTPDPGQYKAGAIWEAFQGKLDTALKLLARTGDDLTSPRETELATRIAQDETHLRKTDHGYDVGGMTRSGNGQQYKTDMDAAQTELDKINSQKRKPEDPSKLVDFFNTKSDLMDLVSDQTTLANTYQMRGQEALTSGQGVAGLRVQTAQATAELQNKQASITGIVTALNGMMNGPNPLSDKDRAQENLLLHTLTGASEEVKSQILGLKDQLFRQGMGQQEAQYSSQLTRESVTGATYQEEGKSAFDKNVEANYAQRERLLKSQAGVELAYVAGNNTLHPEERDALKAQAAQLQFQAIQLRNEEWRAQFGERGAVYEGGFQRLQIRQQKYISEGGSAFDAEYAKNIAIQRGGLEARAGYIQRVADDPNAPLSVAMRSQLTTESEHKRLQEHEIALQAQRQQESEAGARSGYNISQLEGKRAAAAIGGSSVDIYKAENAELDEQNRKLKEQQDLLNNSPTRPLEERLRIQTEINNGLAQELVQRKEATDAAVSSLGDQARQVGSGYSTRAARLELTEGSSPAAQAARKESYDMATQAVTSALALYQLQKDGTPKQAEAFAALETARSEQKSALVANAQVTEDANTRSRRTILEGTLQRQQMSIFQPGAPITEQSELNKMDEAQLKAIHAHEADLRKKGMLTPEVEEQIVGQEEPIKTAILQRQSQMDVGWMDRLVSMSVNSPSFASRILPPPSDIAQIAEKDGFGSLAARVYGFTKKKSYDDTAAMGLLPSDISRFAFGYRPGDNPDNGGIPGLGVASDGGTLSAPLQDVTTGIMPGATLNDGGPLAGVLQTLAQSIAHGINVNITLTNPTTGQQQAVVVNSAANQSGNAIIKGGDGGKASAGQRY